MTDCDAADLERDIWDTPRHSRGDCPNGTPFGSFGLPMPPDANELTPSEIYSWGRAHIELIHQLDVEAECGISDCRWQMAAYSWIGEVGDWLKEALKVGRLEDDPVLDQYAGEVFSGKVPAKTFNEADERFYYAIAHEEVVDEEPHSIGPDDS